MRCHAALAMSATIASLMASLITSARARSVDLVQHAVPARAREEVHEHRAQPAQRRAGAVVLIVLAPRLVRPVDDERLALHELARQEAPIAAVLRVVAVVAHHEVLVRRYGDGPVALAHVERGDLRQLRR